MWGDTYTHAYTDTHIQTQLFHFTRDETILSRKKERKHSRFTWEQLALENVL